LKVFLYYLKIVISCILVFSAQQAIAQEPIKLSLEPYFCYTPGIELNLSSIATIEGDPANELNGLQIEISKNFNTTTDSFAYSSINGITGTFDNVNGVFTLSGKASAAQYQEALDQVFFSSTSTLFEIKTINATLSNLDFLIENGHFYELFPISGISWTAARDAAASKELFGLKGYLATVTTQAEHNFILARVSGTAWIGASDERVEGIWRWVTGPEALDNGGLGRLINIGFTNWDNGEPNNSGGNEHYAHMMDWSTPPGRWNDLPNAGGGGQYFPTGYIVEYGGQVGEPDILANISGSSNIEISQTIEITGATSVCPNLVGAVYTIPEIPGYIISFSVSGGQINLNTNNPNEVSIDWGNTNPSAEVKVVINSIEGQCLYETTLGVVINEQLMPLIPTGNTYICFDELSEEFTYSAISSPGSNYDWHITGGQIVAGQGGYQVQVVWDNPGIGTLYFTESTKTVTDICEGDSPILEIDIRESIEFEPDFKHVSCFGGNNGALEITITQGKDPISFTWETSNQGTINDNAISGLRAGNYSVKINAANCIKEFNFTITQPAELMGTIDAFDVLCFGEATGSAIANITGGTGAYTYKWSGSALNAPSISGLSKGDYTLEVTDENDCLLPLTFSIGEPPLLVLDSIRSTLVSCPNGTDGTLEAFVSGGTAPYSYEWDLSDDVSALATGFPKGEYNLMVTDANGCTTGGSQIVTEAIPKIFLPTAFSPNGDRENDTFGPTTSCDFEFFMTIYNRWGNVIFHTNSTTNQWDGQMNGQPAQSGQYTYIAAWKIEANDRIIAENKRGIIYLIN
jgi:gliding motility-associated-like protein